MKLILRIVLIASAALGWNTVISAATTTTTFGVSATVSSSCSVSASALGFGTIDPLAGTDTDATTTIDVTCSNSTTYDVGLDAGTNSTDVTARKMSDGGTNTLNYSLYSDSGRTTNWGNTVGTDTVSGTGNGSAQTLTVYGRVPSQTTATPASYSDTITVTVTY